MVNTIIFDGEDVIKPDDLEDAQTVSYYKAFDDYRGQDRDVAKYVKSLGMVVSMIGIENQTAPEKSMPIRIMSYDAASYCRQLNTKKSSPKIYPVVTIVLYYGQNKWNYGSNILSAIDFNNVPEKLKPWIADYKMHEPISVSFLTPEEVSKFKSEFWLVADYFTQVKRTGEYNPPKWDLKGERLKLVMDTLNAMSGNNAFADVEEGIKTIKNDEVTNMEQVLNPYTAKKVKEATDKMRAELNPYTEKKVKEATDKGKAEGRAEERSQNIMNIIKSLREESMTDEMIAKVLMSSFDISKDEALKLLSK